MAKAKKEQKKSKRPEGNVKEAREAEEKFDLVEFLKGTKDELGKVVWPSRKQLISESAGVILMVTLVATIVYLFDNLFIWIAGQVF
ncbi:preprotein translocase subunit SecE [Euhalothece natronophila Z-M001]|uniref:Protein translocase subunit SecE n=1 Tax=Euhalothece natronophila Z-M001 TaxID=522448 RepID=A0A5B8NKR1_9CHRO|nr:preprotein translocase subunit SecE [Euhalothece natronophila]QDZ39477.1 preprotein translocase subunit SecE [Euhalothece natronophila Z-M001]